MKTPGRRHDILFFGAIKPYKGVDLLIEAGIALAAKRQDFRIIIAGRPFQSLDDWRTKIVASGAEAAFHFDLDYLPDDRLVAYLRAATIIVFPYREIDGSGSLALASQFDKPIVASNVGVFGEAPVKDHVALVPPVNVTVLQETLNRLLDHPEERAALGRKSRALAEQLPSWQAFATCCVEAYAQLLKERGRPH